MTEQSHAEVSERTIQIRGEP